MNPAGGFTHPPRFADHLHDLLVGKVVKNGDADDMVEAFVCEFEPRAVHHHEPALETGARHFYVVRVDVDPGILTSEAVAIIAGAAADVEQSVSRAWVQLFADQRPKTVRGGLRKQLSECIAVPALGNPIKRRQNCSHHPLLYYPLLWVAPRAYQFRPLSATSAPAN